MQSYVRADKIDFDFLKIKADKIKRVYAVGSGTDYACAVFCAYNMEVLLDVVCVAVTTGELVLSNPVLDKGTLVVLFGDDGAVQDKLSGSGARLVKIVSYSDESQTIRLNYKTLGAFESAEYTLKLAAASLLALYLGEKREVITPLYVKIALQMLSDLPKKIKHILSQEYIIGELAGTLDYDDMVLVGSNVDYGVSLYAAMLFGTAADKYVTALPYGELKAFHKNKRRPFAIASSRDLYNALDSTLAYQLKIVPEDIGVPDDKAFYYDGSIPLLNPLLSSVVIQLLAYKIK